MDIRGLGAARDVHPGTLSGGGFGTFVALSRDGSVVASGSEFGRGVRVLNLVAAVRNVDDAVCRTAYGDDTAAYVGSVGVCSGEGSMDECVVCTGGEYPIGSRAHVGCVREESTDTRRLTLANRVLLAVRNARLCSDRERGRWIAMPLVVGW